ncbi:MAG: nuclear transport factor 2 family protein [Pseudonocardiaceae bacterium]|nr:nuclear transport factor 2 family protein [Pseudonocardiaceae bacterium]
MNEPGKPPQDVPSIGAEQAQRCVDAYIDAWNEPQADKRSQILAQTMTDDSTYVDPAKRTDSRADLSAIIGVALDKSPGRRIVRTSEVDAHNQVCRFNWQLVYADGTRGLESVDFVEFASDGRIRRVTGFFGLLAPNNAS